MPPLCRYPRASSCGDSSSKSQSILPVLPFTYALISTDAPAEGLLSLEFTWIPYSVSMPSTFSTVTAARRWIDSKVLTSSDALYRAPTLGFIAVLNHGANVNDPFPFSPRDLCPVVRVGRVREILVLLVLLLDRLKKVVEANAASLICDRALDRKLLRAANDVFDHRARGKVLEVQNLFVAALVGDLEELVVLVASV